MTKRVLFCVIQIIFFFSEYIIIIFLLYNLQSDPSNFQKQIFMKITSVNVSVCVCVSNETVCAIEYRLWLRNDSENAHGDRDM